MFPENLSKRLHPLLMCAFLLSGLSCSLSSLGGSGSEAPNSLMVIAEPGHVYGVSEPEVSVELYAPDYVPYNDSGFHAATFSDENGRFDFGRVDTGVYNVTVNDASAGRGAFLAGIDAGGAQGSDTSWSSIDSAGSISGIVQDTSGAVYPSLPLYIPGSPFFAVTDADGYFVLSDVPPGDFRLYSKEVPRQGPGKTGARIISVDTAFTCSKGDTKNIGILMAD
jgi:hypothetical protein